LYFFNECFEESCGLKKLPDGWFLATGKSRFGFPSFEGNGFSNAKMDEQAIRGML